MSLNYEELYTLLYAMSESTSIVELSNKLYCSVSKSSKMIKKYEKQLDMKLYTKSESCILNEKGKEVLKKIEKPLFEIHKNLNIAQNKIGVDENLIDEAIVLKGYSYNNIIYDNTNSLIHKYKIGEVDSLVISSDFEEDIVFNTKELVCIKPVYIIKNKETLNQNVYVNKIGCPITKRLELNNYKIDNYLTQSVSICKVVRKGMGMGYTISTDSLNKEQIIIEEKEDLKLEYFHYSI